MHNPPRGRQQKKPPEPCEGSGGDKVGWRRRTLPPDEPAVPSAQRGLTAVFGMGTGVSPALKPPTNSQTRVERGVERPGHGSLEGGCRILGGGVSQASRAISTARLHVLPRFHLPPINVLVSHGPSEARRPGSAHLEGGFPLRCFQRLSLPDVATRQCPWRNNRYTRGQSVPVLSY